MGPARPAKLPHDDVTAGLRLESAFLPDGGTVRGHLVFVHGVAGDVNDEWTVDQSYWPVDVGTRIGGIAVWVASIPAATLRQVSDDILQSLADSFARALRARGISDVLPLGVVARDLGAWVVLRALRTILPMPAAAFVHVHTPLSDDEFDRWRRGLRGAGVEMWQISTLERSAPAILAELTAYRTAPSRYATAARWVADTVTHDAHDALVIENDPSVQETLLSAECLARVETFLAESLAAPPAAPARVPALRQRFALAPQAPGPEPALEGEIEILARGLFEELRRRGVGCFLARNLAPGTKWERELLSALRTCGTFVPFVTDSTDTRRWQMREIRESLARRQTSSEPFVFPCMFTENIIHPDVRALYELQHRRCPIPPPHDLAQVVAEELCSRDGLGVVFLSIPHWHPGDGDAGAGDDATARACRMASQRGIPHRRRLLGLDFLVVPLAHGAEACVTIGANVVRLGAAGSVAAARRFVRDANERLTTLQAGVQLRLPTAAELTSVHAAEVAGFRSVAEFDSELVVADGGHARWWRDADRGIHTAAQIAPHESVAGCVLRPVLQEGSS